MSGQGDMGNLLQQAQKMQRQLDKVREELHRREVEGQAGGGAVRITFTADRQEVHGVHISPDLFKNGDAKVMQDHLTVALEDVLRRALEEEKRAMGEVTGGMNLPGIF